MAANRFPALLPDEADMKGPTRTSNWVIPGKLIAGGYPGSSDPEKFQAIVRSILQTGVTTFVCLMEQEERERKHFVPYEDIAVEIAAEYDRTLSFLYFPFADLSVADNQKLTEFVPELAYKLLQPNELVYVHCWGGHGRTGIIIALLLSVLYNMDAQEALRLTELYHSKREEERVGCSSPQTKEQCEQVKRIAWHLKYRSEK